METRGTQENVLGGFLRREPGMVPKSHLCRALKARLQNAKEMKLHAYNSGGLSGD